MAADAAAADRAALRGSPDPEDERPRRHPVVTVATVLVQADGRFVHWSAGAEALLGYPASEMVGNYAIGLIPSEDKRSDALGLFNRILAGEDWSGTYPLRHRDGHEVPLEFRTSRIDAADAPPLVLAVAVDARSVREVEADLAVLDSFFSQSPVGMAVYDENLRFVRINAALARVNGLPVSAHLGRRVGDVLPGPDGARVESLLRQVLETGEPIVDARSNGPVPEEKDRDHTWSASYSRLQDSSGRVFGVSSSVIDITARHKAEEQAALARERLVLLAEASAAIGATLDLRQAAEELVKALVPDNADACGVHVLERRLNGDSDGACGEEGDDGGAGGVSDSDSGGAGAAGRAGAAARAGPDSPTHPESGALALRRLAFGAAAPDFPLDEVPVGELQCLDPDSPYAEAMRLVQTVVVPAAEMPSVRRDPDGRLAKFFARRAQPVRVVPLMARGTVLGFVSYTRKEGREPFDEQDITLGDELASRAAVAIDNALLYQRERETALARQEALRQVTAAQERLALLNDAGTRIGTTLDLQRTAEELIDVVLPRFADFSTVDLLDSVMQGDEPPSPLPDDKSVVLRAVAVAAAQDRLSGLVSIADAIGETSTFDPNKGYAESLRTGKPLLIPIVDRESLTKIASSPERVEPGLAVGMHSYLMVPLLARGAVLGGAEFIRMRGREPFTAADVALAEDLVARAALCMDNARLYRRERATALTLQRSLLPQEVHHTLGMEIAYRYLPSSVVSEVGGDWFDVVPLSCGRVALVVGDVMGHGIRAAAMMGQLRTVARTLATLDMEPEQVLSRLDDTAASSGDDQFATCVCVVYDPVERSGVAACAGHLPPVIVAPDGSTSLVDLPPGVPLGVGGVPFQSVEFVLPEGSVLALYTDGLVERRGRDISQGIDLLRRVLAERGRSLEGDCDACLAALVPASAEDDVALIMAKALSLNRERVATLALSSDRRLAARARRFTRDKLAAWGLAALTEPAELLVSELVANALTHTGRPRQLRLFCDRVLTVEVADPSSRTPVLRESADFEEGGRGMQLVDELAHRWGSRTTRHGKVVWFELELPAGWPAESMELGRFGDPAAQVGER